MLFLTHFSLHIQLVLRLIWKHFILMEKIFGIVFAVIWEDLGIIGFNHYFRL